MLDVSELEVDLTELIYAYQLLMNRFAPFKKGEQLILAETLTEDYLDEMAWVNCHLFLVAGEPCIVTNIEVNTDNSETFLVTVEFEQERYQDRDGIIWTMPAADRHQFILHEYMVQEG